MSWHGYDLYVSQFVLDEAAAGDSEAAGRRLEVLREMPLLNASTEVLALAGRLLAERGMPVKARIDPLHVATAAVHGMDYMLPSLTALPIPSDARAVFPATRTTPLRPLGTGELQARETRTRSL